MWFKNLTLFSLLESLALAVDELEERLATAAFTPCLSHQLSSSGWSPPLGRQGQTLVHAVNACVLVCLQHEEKVMPAGAIKDLLLDKVIVIEETEQRDVRRKEKERLRDEIIYDLLPRALTRRRYSYAYFDLSNNWLIVNASSAKAVTEITDALRKCLGSLPIAPLQVQQDPAVILTAWLRENSLPEDLVLGDECELRDSEGVVRCKGQDLQGDEIHAHLQAGKQVMRLALEWQERMAMLLCEDLTVRRLRMLDLVQEQLEEVDAETAAELFDAQFVLMTAELREFLPQLLTYFGSSNSAKNSTHSH